MGFQWFFLGYILGCVVTMICVWLAGGSLYAEEEAPDDGANIDAGQPTKAKGIISQILMFIKPAKREKDENKKGEKDHEATCHRANEHQEL